MYWPIVVFAVGVILISIFLSIAGFHVYRFRYRNDVSSAVFILACTLFVAVVIICLATFRWRPDPTTAAPQQLESVL